MIQSYTFSLRDANSKVPTAIHFNVRYKKWGKKRLVYPTGLKVNSGQWNEKSQKLQHLSKSEVKRGTKDYTTEYNHKLNRLKSAADDIFYKYTNANRAITIPILREELNRAMGEATNADAGFVGFMKKFIEEAKIGVNSGTGRKISESTIKLYNNAYGVLLGFAKKKRRSLEYEDITLDFYHDFKSYLIKDKNYATNTIARLIKIIKAVLNAATERGLNTNLDYKKKGFKVVWEKSDSIYLNENELTEIFKLDLSEEPRLDKVRDMFLIGCYTGLRFSDFTQLRSDQIEDNFITIITQKTNQEVIIPLHPVVSAIIEKHNGELPRSISNQKMNDYLKEVAEKVPSLKKEVKIKITKGGKAVVMMQRKCDLVSSHTARRSFATNAYMREIPPFVIMGITGHTTEKSFFAYIKMTPKDKAKLLKSYWEKQATMEVVKKTA